MALDAADLGGGAGPTPDDRDAPHAGTDVLQALGACMVALTDVVALIAARRAPALVAVLSAPRGTHTLMRFTACAVRRHPRLDQQHAPEHRPPNAPWADHSPSRAQRARVHHVPMPAASDTSASRLGAPHRTASGRGAPARTTYRKVIR